MIVIGCPGQGSQKPGFLAPWLEREGARELLESVSDACGVDLVAHGTTSDAETIRDTAVAQPLIVAAGLLTLRALRESAPEGALGAFAGHSVGEITAAAAAGVLSEEDAVRFVSIRAKAMAEAARRAKTGMSAVLGGDQDRVVAHVESFGLEAANYNGGGQLVAAGSLDDLARLGEEPLRGTRVVPLQVAGAFHTRYMVPAREQLAGRAGEFTPADPTATLWTNHDGSSVTSGRAFLDLLVGQVASPVRWDRCTESFLAEGITGFIELAPAGALTGLAKRGMRGVPTVAITSPDDLPAALDLLQNS